MATLVQNHSDYIKLVGVNNTSQPNKLKAVLEQQLSDIMSPLRISLAKLTEHQKSLFIVALLTNDSLNISNILTPLLIKNGTYGFTPYLSQISEHEKVSETWLNPTVTLLIASMLYVHPSNETENARTARILQNAMQMIPESKIHIKAKVHLCREVDFSAAEAISDYSYNESLTPLSDNRFSGNVTVKEYTSAINATPLDYSEYILLTLGVLQQTLSGQKGVQNSLANIRTLYLETNYEQALSEIELLTTNYARYLNADLVQLIAIKSTNLVEVELDKNYSRRFFENRLSQLYSGLQINLANIDRVSHRIINKHVTTIEEAEDAVLKISEDSANSEQIEFRVEELKEQSNQYLSKDRMDKTGFSDKSMEAAGTVFEQETYSRNKGVLTSNSPNYYDELTEQEMRNRIVDISSTYGEDVAGYSYSNPRSSFVGSYSGHCFKIVATLERYMQQHPNDINLQQDINACLKMVVVSYISRGYHGFSEMVDVLKEPHIQEVFTNCGVALDISWSDDLIEKASKDTQEYTKTLCLRKTVRNSLLSQPTFWQKASDDTDEDNTKSQSHQPKK